MSTPTPPANVMEAIVSLAKRRGFIYQASEIYGGIRGFWDYGPLGVLLKNNIRDHWWRNMVECPPIGPDGHPIDMVGLDSSIIQHPTTWKASGHADTFTDPMVDDKAGGRHRADQLFGLLPDMSDSFYQQSLAKFGEVQLTIPVATCVASSLGEATEIFLTDRKIQKLFGIKSLAQDEDAQAAVAAAGLRGAFVRGTIRGKESSWSVHSLYEPGFANRWNLIPSPLNGEKETLSEPRPFNLMLDTYPGPIRSEENKAYLRPETAQGIFLNFKNVVDTTRVKVPFGVAQVGKSFRNEVTPRNFIFRSREFEQMEMEFFCPPDDSLMWFEFWKQQRMNWWLSLGIKPENLIFRDHASDELSFYSKATVDIEYRYPFTAPDFGELEGIAHRGSYDLNAHSRGSKSEKTGWVNEFSNAKLDYFDQDLQLKLKEQGVAPDEIKKRSRYIPNVIEPASGLTRAVLVLLCEGYRYDETRPSKEYFAFKPELAPIKAGIFPLVNKDGMPEIAEKLYLDLRSKFTLEYDPKQTIGKRYARMDEIGTPFCVTVDGGTVGEQIVTIRNRDTQQQDKVNISQVETYLRERL